MSNNRQRNQTKLMVMYNSFEISGFEKEWRALAIEICKAIYKHPKIQQLRANLQKNGFLTLEEKSTFIDICDMVKYKIIYDKYGPEHSESYRKFTEHWRLWFQTKGVASERNSEQRNSVNHIMFGSTPDPLTFLLKFETEINS